MNEYDAIVVGARAAGAATAMLLARQGLRVLAVDRGRYASDTLSTHALMRGAVLQLYRWGLLERLQRGDTPAVRSVSFHYGDDVLTIPVKRRDGVEALYAPRRTVLDRLLADAASESGADVRFGVRVTALMRSHSGRVSGVVLNDPLRGVREVSADLVIGADGLRSTVGRLVEAPAYHRGRHASGVVYARWTDLGLDGYQWHYRPGVSAGVIPTNNGETCIFVAIPSARVRTVFGASVAAGYHLVLAEAAPTLAKQVARAAPASAFHGFSGEIGFLRQSWGPGWALVGDAGSFRDPLTAHGLTDALRDAELLADAVGRGSDRALADYQRGRDELTRCLFDISGELASFGWDLESVRVLHQALAREMANEVKVMTHIASEHTRGAAAASRASIGPRPVAPDGSRPMATR